MPSFGEELRRERELREISLREVSDATKINLRYLEALERNEFGDLPEGVVFRRGYVRAYCQHIGVDPEAMVNAYLLEEQSQASGAVDGGLLRGRADRSDPSLDADSIAQSRRTQVVVVIAAAVLALAAGATWWWLSRGAS